MGREQEQEQEEQDGIHQERCGDFFYETSFLNPYSFLNSYPFRMSV